MGQSDPAPRRFARHSHRDCGVHFGSDFSTEPRIRPATDCATCLATESVSESESHGAVGCRTRPRTGCGADGAIECALVCRADFGVLPRVGFRVLPGAEARAKSLINGHVDGRVVFGIECRSHPRIDPPVAGASAGLDLGPQAAGWDRSRSGLYWKRVTTSVSRGSSSPPPLSRGRRVLVDCRLRGILTFDICPLTFDLRVLRAP